MLAQTLIRALALVAVFAFATVGSAEATAYCRVMGTTPQSQAPELETPPSGSADPPGNPSPTAAPDTFGSDDELPTAASSQSPAGCTAGGSGTDTMWPILLALLLTARRRFVSWPARSALGVLVVPPLDICSGPSAKSR